MKKLLTASMLAIASFLLILFILPGQAFAFDPETDSYEDLFYYEDVIETYTVNYSIDGSNIDVDFNIKEIFDEFGIVDTSESVLIGGTSYFLFQNIAVIDTDIELIFDYALHLGVMSAFTDWYPVVILENIDENPDLENAAFRFSHYPSGDYANAYNYGGGGENPEFATISEEFYITYEVVVKTLTTKSTGLQLVSYTDSENYYEPEPPFGWIDNRLDFIQHFLAGTAYNIKLYVSLENTGGVWTEDHLVQWEAQITGGEAGYFMGGFSADDITIYIGIRYDGTLFENGLYFSGEDAPDEPVIIRYEFEYDVVALQPWTQAYTYGRYRTDEPLADLHLHHETDGWHIHDEVVFIGSNPTSHALSKGIFADNESDLLIQSPYQNFRIYAQFSPTVLLEVENVAAVFFKNNMTEDNTVIVYAYYWLDGEIEVETYTWTGIETRTMVFYGGYRYAISGNAVIIGDVEDDNDLDYYLGFLTAWDDIDGNISDQIYVIDDNGYNGAVVGTYSIEVGVTDSENQESTFEFFAVVADLDAPTLVAPNLNQTISYTQTFNFSTYLASLVKTDNYYDESDITITLQENNYTANKTIPDIYTVTLRVADPSLNYTDYTLNITVIDDVAPVFTAGVVTLSKDINQMITVSQIISTQSVIDAIDGNVSSSITIIYDDYTGNETTPGTYEVIIEAQDSAGNIVQRILGIGVFSGVAGWWLPDDGPIIIPNGAELSFEQFKAVLISVGFIAPDVEVTLLSSNYFGNEGTPGTYTLNLSVGGVPTQFNVLVLNQNDPWFPPMPPLVSQPNFDWAWWIVGAFAFAAVIGGAIFYFKKRKTT